MFNALHSLLSFFSWPSECFDLAWGGDEVESQEAPTQEAEDMAL